MPWDRRAVLAAYAACATHSTQDLALSLSCEQQLQQQQQQYYYKATAITQFCVRQHHARSQLD